MCIVTAVDAIVSFILGSSICDIFDHCATPASTSIAHDEGVLRIVRLWNISSYLARFWKNISIDDPLYVGGLVAVRVTAHCGS